MVSSTPAHRFFAALVFTISIMQLVDAALWASIRYRGQWLNAIVSAYAIPFVLSLELAMSYYGVRYYFGWSNRWFENVLWLAIATIFYRTVTMCTETVVHRTGYLMWCNMPVEWYSKLAFLAVLTLPVVLGCPNSPIKFLVLAGVFTSFLVNYMDDTFTSKWCWSFNVVAPVLLLLVLIERYKIIR